MTEAVDERGNPVGSRSPLALAAAERALQRLMSFDEGAHAEMQAAAQADPGWLLPRLMQAGAQLARPDHAGLLAARRLVDEASAWEAGATARERAHLAALQQLLEGRWHQACDTWDELLLQHPRDALALHWAHGWDLLRGDTASLRSRPARSLPEWPEHDPLQPAVLALYAFGLAEGQQYALAEETGRRALAGGAWAPCALRAVAQAMEAQGRFEDGAAWLRQHQPAWADAPGVAHHLWWLMGLFRLEALDDGGALRLLDKHLAGDALHSAAQRVDAAALLWRLHLMGVDVGPRLQLLAQGWPLDDADAGLHALHDLHVVIALAGGGEIGRAERWLARCAERAMQPEDARRSNHATAREVGLPAMRAVLAYQRGDHAAVAQILYPLRRAVHRLGGSHAQRDLLDQTLLAACACSGQHSLGRALFNERLMAKPATPLTRHWALRLGLQERLPA